MTNRQPRQKTPSGKILSKSAASRQSAKRVKTAKGRKISSTRWLQRQLNDPYVEDAKQKGYRSRAAFKLLDIQKKFDLIKPNMTIIDLGAAPGGWSQICADITGSISNKGQVVALDIQDMPELPGVNFIQGDFTDSNIILQLSELTGCKADMVISDMAPFTIGIKSADQIRILNLAEAAIEFSLNNLKQGGHFVSKLFEGGGGKDLSEFMKNHFEKVNYFKPSSSRSDSSEIFLIGKSFKGN